MHSDDGLFRRYRIPAARSDSSQVDTCLFDIARPSGCDFKSPEDPEARKDYLLGRSAPVRPD